MSGMDCVPDSLSQWVKVLVLSEDTLTLDLAVGG